MPTSTVMNAYSNITFAQNSTNTTIVGAEQLEQLKAKLMRWSIVAPKEVERVLKGGAEMVRKEAQLHHLSGPKMPRGVGGGWTWGVGTGYSASLSAGGNATLAVQTGTLRRSIAIRVSVQPGKIEALVGTSVPYGRYHEFGNKTWAIGKGFTGNLPARPWLRPSLQAKHSTIFKMLDEAWFKAYGK